MNNTDNVSMVFTELSSIVDRAISEGLISEIEALGIIKTTSDMVTYQMHKDIDSSINQNEKKYGNN